MSIDVTVPQIGESVTTVFIARWIKAPGDAVAEGESVVEIDSDKASMEVPAPRAGVMAEHLAQEGDEVEVGSTIARMTEGDGAAAPAAEAAPAAAAAPAAPAAPAAAAVAEAPAAPVAEAPAAPAPAAAADVKAGPAARQAAREGGVDLQKVDGTGKGGRVLREDVERVRTEAPAAAPAKAKAPSSELIERVPMTPLRRTIARRLVEAQSEAAMLTTFNEVDMTAVMDLRAQYQDTFVKRYGIKLGFMSFFLKAAVSALVEFPAVNAEIDGNDILYKRFYNIGVAVSGPKGLVVPVVKSADTLSFSQTEQAIADLAGKARDNRLQLSDFADGTFTVTNGGIFGSMMSTPILNRPQVAILGMHNIVKRAVVVDDEIVIRPMMYLALSYDHRIIDGREAVSFLVRIKELIENPERILLEV